MHQELSRSLNILVWENIDLQNLNQYLDSLKSRIYKETAQKSYQKIHDAQFKLLTSPLVKLIAFKQVLDESHHTLVLKSFQIGYWIFYFTLDTDINNSIFLSPDSDVVLNPDKDIRLIFNKVKSLIINWSLKPYFDHLHELNQVSCLNYYSDYTDLTFKNEFYAYCFSLDLKSLFYYINLSVVINRMNFLCSIRKYLGEFLDHGLLIGLINSLGSCSRLCCLKKNEASLINNLIHVFMLIICYEIDVLFNSYINYISYPVIIINYAAYLLIYCEDFVQLQLWKKSLLDVLIANGVKIKHIRTIQNILSLKYVDNSPDLINLLTSSLNIFSSPSLHCQYFLMKQVSILLKKSRSKPLFLLVIRLNMLLISWSALYRTQQVNKTFSLLDYIIYLKLRSLIKKFHNHWPMQKIRSNYFPFKLYSFNRIQAKTNWVLITRISNSNFYRIFNTIKLFWFML